MHNGKLTPEQAEQVNQALSEFSEHLAAWLQNTLAALNEFWSEYRDLFEPFILEESELQRKIARQDSERPSIEETE